VSWARGSQQDIKWSHNLGSNSYVRITLSRDGGATYPEVLASSVKNASSSSGAFIWRVTGPNVSNAMVRVSWTDGPVSDSSNVPFQIVEPALTVTTPGSTSTNWGGGTLQRVKWTTNLGRHDTVKVLMSTDGGATFPTTLASVAASTKYADVTLPVVATATSAARIRVVWSNAPSGTALSSNSSLFTLAPPYVTLTAPNGGETLTSGTSAVVKWASNLGPREFVRIELSTDGGATWPHVAVPSTPSDGAQSVSVAGVWAGSATKVRLVWLKNGAVADISNAGFTVK
jgi:hypothetical protein